MSTVTLKVEQHTPIYSVFEQSHSPDTHEKWKHPSTTSATQYAKTLHFMILF